jgi:hypothetical protein
MNTPHFIPIFIIIEDFDKFLIFKTFEPSGLISIALSSAFVNSLDSTENLEVFFVNSKFAKSFFFSHF